MYLIFFFHLDGQPMEFQLVIFFSPNQPANLSTNLPFMEHVEYLWKPPSSQLNIFLSIYI